MVIALIVVAAIVVLLLIAFWVSYNRFIKQRNLVQESWRQIDVELQRRHDLIPNLVNTAKGYASHEKAVFENVTAARSRATDARAATPQTRAEAENALGRATTGLLALAEQYPNLKASEQFLALQQQLGETEDRIAAGRRFYNGNVRSLNTRVESFPSALVASMFHFEKAEYFEVDDPAVRAPVQVDFS
jgi:LemA protein